MPMPTWFKTGVTLSAEHHQDQAFSFTGSNFFSAGKPKKCYPNTWQIEQIEPCLRKQSSQVRFTPIRVQDRYVLRDFGCVRSFFRSPENTHTLLPTGERLVSSRRSPSWILHRYARSTRRAGTPQGGDRESQNSEHRAVAVGDVVRVVARASCENSGKRRFLQPMARSEARQRRNPQCCCTCLAS